MIWVIDASVAVRWLIEDESHPHADEVLEKAVQHPENFAVPELFEFIEEDDKRKVREI
jgi:hypothetical protein